MDFWLRTAVKFLGQAPEQSAANQGQVGQQVGIARARAVLPHEDVPSPVIADFHSRPMAADALEPLCRLIVLGRKAGEIVTGFGAGGTGLFKGAPAAHHDQGSGVREVGCERFDGEGVHGALFDASVAEAVFGKKGVLGKRSSA